MSKRMEFFLASGIDLKFIIKANSHRKQILIICASVNSIAWKNILKYRKAETMVW